MIGNDTDRYQAIVLWIFNYSHPNNSRPNTMNEIGNATIGREPKAPTERPITLVGPLVSIIIPCVGMLQYTKLCVTSILKHSRPPYELIFLDIGSLDGTPEYLEGLRTGLQSTRVDIVSTPTDLGIKDACRNALQRSRGEFIVLLNNDTIVTNAWLNQLIGLVNMSPGIGLVGPMSNYAAPPQLVESVPYRFGPRKNADLRDTYALVDIDAVNDFSLKFRENHKGKWLESERLGGFCLMMKREVIKRVNSQGELDKWTDLSLFDTDILSSKARQAGYTLAACRDLFIHHFGTRTFAHGAPEAKRTTAATAEEEG